MATAPKVGVGYNAQVAVDDKYKLIVSVEVTNEGSDLGLLAQTACQAKDALGVETIEAVADRGYFKGEDLKVCEDAGIKAYVPRPQRGPAVRDGFFRKDEFSYDPSTDTYQCPGKQELHPIFRSTAKTEWRRYENPAACKACVLRTQCTNSSPHRQVGRWINEAVLDRMEARLALRPHIMKRRSEIIEHVFGTIKQGMNQGAFLMRRLENVSGEFNLTALAYNIRRSITIVGVAGLLEAV
jgi:hypothetical protein